MKTLKKTVRFLVLTLIIIAAATGAGFLAAFVPNRPRYVDKEIRIERVEKNANDEDENNHEKKN